MAHRNIEIVIGRLVTDEAFRTAFLCDAAEALAGFVESGYELTALEIAALRTTHADAWTRAAAEVDPRLQRASFHRSGGR